MLWWTTKSSPGTNNFNYLEFVLFNATASICLGGNCSGMLKKGETEPIPMKTLSLGRLLSPNPSLFCNSTLHKFVWFCWSKHMGGCSMPEDWIVIILKTFMACFYNLFNCTVWDNSRNMKMLHLPDLSLLYLLTTIITLSFRFLLAKT